MTTKAKRWLLGFSIFAFFLIILHSAPARHSLKGLLVKWATSKLGGTVHIGDLDYELWRGEVALRSFHLSKEGFFSFGAEEITLHWFPFTGASARVLGPRLTLQQSPGTYLQSPGTGTESTGAGDAMLEVLPALTSLQLMNGSIVVIDSNGEPWLDLSSIEVDLDSRQAGAVTFETGSLAIGNTQLVFGPLKADFQVHDGRLALTNAILEKGGSWIEMQGTITALSPFLAELDAQLHLDAEDARDLLPDWELGGQIVGKAHLVADSEGTRVDIGFRSPHLNSPRIGEWAAEGELTTDGNTLELTRLHLAGYECSIDAKGHFDIGGARYSVEAVLSDLAIAQFGPPIASRVGGVLRLELTGLGWDTVDGNGRLTFEPSDDDRAIPLAGIVELSAQSGVLRFESNGLTLPEGELTFEGELRQDGRMAARYNAAIREFRKLDPLLLFAGVPELPPDLGGTLAIQGDVSGSWHDPDSLSSDLTVVSDRMEFGEQIFGLETNLRITGDSIEIHDLLIPSDHGSISARGIVPLAAPGSLQLGGYITGFDFTSLANRFGIPSGGVAHGSFHVSGDEATASFRLDPLVVRGTNGRSSFELRKRGRELRIERLEAELGEGRARASGTYHLDTAELSVQLDAERFSLNELLGGTYGVDGVISSAEAHVKGALPAIEGRARIALDGLSLHETELPPLLIEAQSNGETVHVEVCREKAIPVASVETELTSPYATRATIDLSALPLDLLLRGLHPSTPEDTRLLSRGRLDISLPLQTPENLEYRAEVEQLVGYYRGIGGGAGSTFVVDGDLNSLSIHELDLVGTGTAIAVDGTIPLVPGGSLNLRLKGDVRLELLTALLQESELSGNASFDLLCGGRLTDPRLEGELSVENVDVSWNGLHVGAIAAELEAREGRALIRKLTGEILGGTFLITGESPIPHPSDSAPARFTIRVTDFDLGELMPRDADSAIEPLVLLSTTGTFAATGYELENVTGTGEISMLWTSLGDIVIENSESIPWHLDGGRLDVPHMRMSGGDTNLEINFHAEKVTKAWIWRSSLDGEIDNTYVNPIIQPVWDAVALGTTKLSLEAAGENGSVDLHGKAVLDGSRLVIREPSLVLTNLMGEVTFDGPAITLSKISAEAGGGRIEASGNIDLGDQGTSVHGLDIGLEATRVGLDYPSGLQSSVSGSLRLRGGAGIFLLSGDLRILDGFYGKDLSLDAGLVEPVGRRSVALADEETVAETILLDVRVQSVEDIRIDNNLVRAATGADLRVSGSMASPEIDGVVTVRPEGTFRLGRNFYKIESGSILLRDYPSEPAELRMTARTSVSGQEIEVNIRGDTDNVVMDLEAPRRPDLTQDDLAQILLTGRTRREVDKFDTAAGQGKKILQEQLMAYMGGAIADIARAGLGGVLPLDEISVAPVDLGSEVDPELRFSLGKALSDDLFVTYSIGLENTQSQLWIVDYQLPKRLSLRATRREDNTLTGALNQKLQFKFPGRPEQPDIQQAPVRVGEADIVGAPADLEKTLADTIRLRRNDRYDYWKAQEDIRQLTQALRDEGYLNAFVTLETEPSGEGKIELRYVVEPGLPVRVKWEGDDPGGSIRKKVVSAWDGRLPERFLLTELSQLAALELQRKGFYTARVEAKASDASDGRRQVTFLVDEGPRGKRIDIQFKGNLAFTDAELIQALPRRSSVDFFKLVFQDQEALRNILRSFYLSRGYLEVRIDKPTSRYESTTGIYWVVVPIEEGSRATVTEVRFEGADALDEARLAREAKIVAGRPFDLAAFTETRTALASLYRRQGFTEARVRGRLDPTEDGLDVVFTIDEGQRAKVGDIRVRGNHATRESIIRRQVTFRTGDPLNVSELTETQRKLYDLGIFRSVDVRTEASAEDPSVRNVLIDVSETKDIDFGYGFRYSSEDGPEVPLNIRFANLLGAAQHLGLNIVANKNDYVARANFFTPYIGRYDLNTDLFVAREKQEDDLLTTRSWKLTFQQNKNLASQLKLQWSYTYRYGRTVEKESSGPFPFDVTTHQSILTTSLIEDRRDSLFQPTRGRLGSITFQYAPNGLGSDVPFVKLFGRLFTFISLGRGVVWAGGYRLGFADAFEGLRLLPDDRFKAGGSTTVRGFKEDSLGPQLPFTGGEGLVIFNEEIRFPVHRWLRGVVFYDAGNVFRNAGDFRLFDLRHSAGAGLRVALPFGLLRFDWAWPLDRQTGEDTYQFWFSLNHAF